MRSCSVIILGCFAFCFMMFFMFFIMTNVVDGMKSMSLAEYSTVVFYELLPKFGLNLKWAFTTKEGLTVSSILGILFLGMLGAALGGGKVTYGVFKDVDSFGGDD